MEKTFIIHNNDVDNSCFWCNRLQISEKDLEWLKKEKIIEGFHSSYTHDTYWFVWVKHGKDSTECKEFLLARRRILAGRKSIR